MKKKVNKEEGFERQDSCVFSSEVGQDAGTFPRACEQRSQSYENVIITIELLFQFR